MRDISVSRGEGKYIARSRQSRGNPLTEHHGRKNDISPSVTRAQSINRKEFLFAFAFYFNGTYRATTTMRRN